MDHRHQTPHPQFHPDPGGGMPGQHNLLGQQHSQQQPCQHPGEVEMPGRYFNQQQVEHHILQQNLYMEQQQQQLQQQRQGGGGNGGCNGFGNPIGGPPGFYWPPPPPGVPLPPANMLHAPPGLGPPGIQQPGLQGMMAINPPAPAFQPQVPSAKRGRPAGQGARGVKGRGHGRQEDVITLGDSPNGSPAPKRPAMAVVQPPFAFQPQMGGGLGLGNPAPVEVVDRHLGGRGPFTGMDWNQGHFYPGMVAQPQMTPGPFHQGIFSPAAPMPPQFLHPPQSLLPQHQHAPPPQSLHPQQAPPQSVHQNMIPATVQAQFNPGTVHADFNNVAHEEVVEAPPVLVAEIGEQEMDNQERQEGDQENPQPTIEQLRAELDNVKFQLYQARQAIEEKDQMLKDQGQGVGQLNREKASIEKKNQDLRVSLDGQKKEIDALKLKMAELERIQSPPNTCSSASTAQPSPLTVRVEASTQTETAERITSETQTTQGEEPQRARVRVKDEVVEEPEEMADAGSQGGFRPVAVKEEPVQEQPNEVEVLGHYPPENNVFATFEEAVAHFNSFFKEAQLLARIEGEFGETFTVAQLRSEFFFNPEGVRVAPQPRIVVHLCANAFYGHFRKVTEDNKSWSSLTKGERAKWTKMKKDLQFVQREMERHGLIEIICKNGRRPRLG
ncbi:hypothetical protein CAEBREN_18048 [Caenorhabditis brenneri]|uniref:Uncharacterized protein n=1 Tax=Caenorhabditis brenneri TaxID=135651 RepID=G0MMT4_CAEBE|nr:hypothetical protein CAEBREN_18048 [Caenorhabditis brenneri]